MVMAFLLCREDRHERIQCTAFLGLKLVLGGSKLHATYSSMNY